MENMLNFLFREDETINPRLAVAGGIVAYAVLFFVPVFGLFMSILFVPILVIGLALGCFAVLRFLFPLMDPRHPSSDRFAVWGGLVLFLLTGWFAFGVFFLPAVLLGIGLIWLRAPEFLEVIPQLEGQLGRGRR